MGIFDNFLAPFTTSAQDKAASDQQAGLQSGYNQLAPLLAQGRQSLGTSLANSTAAFLPNLTTGQAGQQTYADATGANGAAGSTRALANFQADPSYQYNIDQQNQNILRAQEATGQAASGATNADIAKEVSGNANNQWQSYISNLAPFLNSSNAAATGISAANTNAGNQENQSFTTEGNAAYGTAAGIGNAQASADLAPLTAGKNIIGAGMDVASMVAGLPPGMFSGGSGGVLPGGAPLGQGGIGHAADGGPIPGNRPTLVGERGPELFVPKKPGMVIPHEVLAAAMAARSPRRGATLRKAA